VVPRSVVAGPRIFPGWSLVPMGPGYVLVGCIGATFYRKNPQIPSILRWFLKMCDWRSGVAVDVDVDWDSKDC